MSSEVLIVTRDPALRQQLAEILHQGGYSLTATDATAPVAALPARLDCLLAIVDLSGAADDAHHALQAIRRRAPDLPMVGVTDDLAVGTLLRARARGVEHCIARPLVPGEVLDTIAHSIDLLAAE